MVVKELKSVAEFDELIASSTGLVIVDFTATWCGPCRMVAPHYKQLSEENTTVTFTKVDVDEVEELPTKCGVNCYPTFQFYKSGKKIAEVQGADIAKITSLVAEHK